MATSSVFVNFNYIIANWYFHLYVLISSLIQSEPALNQRCLALKAQFSEQRKSALNSADSELILFEAVLNFSILNSADSEKMSSGLKT